MILNNSLLKASMFLGFEQRELANVADVEYFIDRFEILGGRDDPILLNKIHEEFPDYQLLNRGDIPKSVWQEAGITLILRLKFSEWMLFGPTWLACLPWQQMNQDFHLFQQLLD